MLTVGFELRREVRDQLLWPGALTPSERVLVLELADNAGEKTRVGYPGMEWILAKCDIPSKQRAGEHLASIAAKWFELRVELGKDKNGKPLYAMPGKKTTYRFPTRAELVARHGEGMVPEIQGLDACKVPENQGAMVPEIQGADGPKVPEIQGPFSSKNFLLKEHPSSLSPAGDDSAAPAPVGPTPRERDISTPSEPKTETPNPVHRMLIKHGAPADRVEDIKDRIDTIKNVQHDGFYFTADRNGSLTSAVGEALEDLDTTPAQHCDACNDTGSVGDWMNRRACDCQWFTNPAGIRKTWVAQLDAFEPCVHGTRGGDQVAPNGWQHCSLCRGPGWVDPKLPTRTEKNPPGHHRSVGTMRAEQALRVADDLDRRFGHGKYANTADGRASPGKHVPFRNPPNADAYRGEL